MTDPRTGGPLITMGDFASRARNRKIYHHGKSIAVSLAREAAAAGVIVLEQTMAVDLLTGDGGVGGVLALGHKGKPLVIRAGATVLTTGGAGQLFRFSLLPPDVTGDGYALAYRAGAVLANMEFMQAGFGTIKPALNAVQPWFWLLFPRFLDRDGADILDPSRRPPEVTVEEVLRAKSRHYPFSTSDPSMWLEISAKLAQEEGKATALGGFSLDLRNVDLTHVRGTDVETMWQISKEWLLRKGLDVDRAPLAVGLFGHAINGGACISADGETNVAGLLAAGEASTGPYGADRLGGNMLLNCQVFGRRAGVFAAERGRARRHEAERISGRRELDALRERIARMRADAPPIRAAIDRIKDNLTDNLLIVRRADGLARAEAALRQVQAELEDGAFALAGGRDLFRLHEAFNLIDVGRMMVAAAALRKESRGSHYRADFPHRDPAWDRPILIRRGGQGPVLSAGPFPGN